MNLQLSPHRGAVNKHTQLQLSWRPTHPQYTTSPSQPSPVILHRPLDKMTVASRLAKRYVADLKLQGSPGPRAERTPSVVSGETQTVVTHSSPVTYLPHDGKECTGHKETIASLQQQVNEWIVLSD